MLIGGGEDAGKFVEIRSPETFAYNFVFYTPIILHPENSAPFVFAVDDREHGKDHNKALNYLLSELQIAYAAQHQPLEVS
jgi:hypothetical protein